MAKITFEFEVEIDGDEKIQGVQLSLMRNGEWESACLFAGRPQRVREGKHLKFENDFCTVVKVGEK